MFVCQSQAAADTDDTSDDDDDDEENNEPTSSNKTGLNNKKHFLFQAKQLTLRISSINKIYNHLVNYQGQCDQIGLFCLQISHQSIPKI